MWFKQLLLTALVICCWSFAESAEPFSCIKCDSSTDPNCIADLSKITTKEAACEFFCFTKVDTATGKVTRGCEPDSAGTCADDDTCRQCKTNDCNNYKICKKCDSSTDGDCAQTNASKDTYNSVCAAENTKCLSNIKEKHVERRCAAAADSCADNNTCQQCDGANCNVGYFPNSRIHCFQCNDASDSKCSNVVANSIEAKPCLLYDAADKCYTYGTEETKMTRGCVSDADTTVNKCSKPESDALCLACNTDNCNNALYEHAQQLKCIMCTSTATDDKCKWGQQTSSATNCQKSILYNQDELCYTQTKEGTVYRGCYHDRDVSLGDCTDANSCSKCGSSEGDGCNSKDNANFTCIRCRSDDTPDCRNDADKLKGADCRNTVTESNSGCFWGIWNDVVIRGCLVDADNRMLTVCNDANDKQCSTCKEKDCNTAKAGAASLTLASAALLASLLSALWRPH